MKTLYRCVDHYHYTFHTDKCPQCGASVENPYPARFSLIKEMKYRHLIRKYQSESDE